MVFAPSKKLGLIRSKNKNSNNLILNVNGLNIEEVESIKFLGIIIQNYLSWTKQISYLTTKFPK